MRLRTTSEDYRQERREQIAADMQAHHTDLEVVDDGGPPREDEMVADGGPAAVDGTTDR